MNLKRVRIFYFLIVFIVIFLFFYFDFHNIFKIENIEIVRDYFTSLGYWSPVYMIVIYVLFNIAAIPRVFFTVFSGYVYGLIYGFIFAWIATIIGLAVTFISIRYLFKGKFEEKFGGKEIVKKLNEQIEKKGIFIIIFLRAIYVIPSSILNYSFGFTRIKTRTYLLGSTIGFVPVVFVNVYAGYIISINLKVENEINYYYLIIAIMIIVLIAMLLKNLLNKMEFFNYKN